MEATDVPVKDYMDCLIFPMKHKKARPAAPDGPFGNDSQRAGACGRLAGSTGTSTVAETLAGASGSEPMRG